MLPIITNDLFLIPFQPSSDFGWEGVFNWLLNCRIRGGLSWIVSSRKLYCHKIGKFAGVKRKKERKKKTIVLRVMIFKRTNQRFVVLVNLLPFWYLPFPAVQETNYKFTFAGICHIATLPHTYVWLFMHTMTRYDK